ncbi:MAG: ABC transporter permease [Cyanobacteria bacterium]|nr:ABC transporter permease [Cyanobacteriota bacterium]MDW8202594.1 ABC transporter permease [Cyanobacteriota bacterium SKYGB_h_bin112]
MPWEQILTTTFLMALCTAGIRLAVPVLLAVLGEIITERAGVMNLGLEGIMLVGGLTGFMVANSFEKATQLAELAAWLGLLAGLAAGGVMGLLLAGLVVTWRTDQVVTGVTFVLLGQGLTAFLYRKQFSGLGARVTGLREWALPLLSKIPVLGEVLFTQTAIVYLTGGLVFLCWFVLFRTNWGLEVRAVGENPAAADTSGIDVTWIRYVCVVLGAALAGLGGAVLTVVQLKLFTEGITAGRGWIAIALVVFSRWQPIWALVGALLFGIADALQFRIQALGSQSTPYEFLLMLPYGLTLAVLLLSTGRSNAPAALGIPYTKGDR